VKLTLNGVLSPVIRLDLYWVHKFKRILVSFNFYHSQVYLVSASVSAFSAGLSALPAVVYRAYPISLYLLEE
jgi:hypothetical protein